MGGNRKVDMGIIVKKAVINQTGIIMAVYSCFMTLGEKQCFLLILQLFRLVYMSIAILLNGRDTWLLFFSFLFRKQIHIEVGALWKIHPCVRLEQQ